MIQDFHGKLPNVTKSILLFLQLLHVTAEEAIDPGAVSHHYVGEENLPLSKEEG